jgi:hypothetical protein
MNACILIIVDSKSDEMTKPEAGSPEPIPLPDIMQVFQKKAIEESVKAEEEENKEQQVKINRRDKEAFARVSYGFPDFLLSIFCVVSIVERV